MFQATMTQVSTFRKIIDSLKDLVTEVNIEANSGGKKNQKNINFRCISSSYG